MNATQPKLGATLPKKWLSDFTIALRAREVSGAVIGDAIKSVEEYCAESGQPPQDAFGDAREYAAALDLPSAKTDRTSLAQLRDYLPTGVVLLGLMIPPAIESLKAGSAFGVSVGAVFAVIVCAVLLGVVARFFEALVTRGWLGMAVLCLAFYAVVFAPLMLRHELFGVNPWVPLAIGVAGLVLGTYFGAREMGKTDEVVDPTLPAQRSRASWLMLAPVIGFPVVIAALSVVAWLT